METHSSPVLESQLTDITGLRQCGIFPAGKEPSIRTLIPTCRPLPHDRLCHSGRRGTRPVLSAEGRRRSSSCHVTKRNHDRFPSSNITRNMLMNNEIYKYSAVIGVRFPAPVPSGDFVDFDHRGAAAAGGARGHSRVTAWGQRDEHGRVRAARADEGKRQD